MASCSCEENPCENIKEDDISLLASNVRNFQKSLEKLKEALNTEKVTEASFQIDAHKNLSDFLQILRSVLKTHPSLQTNDLLLSAGRLIHYVKDLEDLKPVLQEILDSVDLIALAFSSRVSEYIMHNTQASEQPPALKRLDYSVPEGEDQNTCKNETCKHDFSTYQYNVNLQRLDQAIEQALHINKLWSKYTKNILIYIEKRIYLDMDYARNITGLAQDCKKDIHNEDTFPLQSVYSSSLDNDIENGSSHEVTCNLLLGNKFIQTLKIRHQEHERQRKMLKRKWHHEVAVFTTRNFSYPYDTDSHSLTSETASGNTPSDLKFARHKDNNDYVNDDYEEMRQKKEEILRQLYLLIMKSESILKDATINYFQLQHNLSAPIPKQFQTLCESCRLYDPDCHYAQLTNESSRLSMKNINEIENVGITRKTSIDMLENDDLYAGSLGEVVGNANELTHWKGAFLSSFYSDTDSITSSNSDRSHDMLARPSNINKNNSIHHDKSHNEIPQEEESQNVLADTPNVKSSESDTLSYPCPFCHQIVQGGGIKCVKCNTFCHRDCLKKASLTFNYNHEEEKHNTFGVELIQHLAQTSKSVPYIVSKCTCEIDTRGITTMGIYRVSSAKSKVESLCNLFENAKHDVDLSEEHPNTIANVLKLYLYKLPEPLMTFKLYSEFLNTAKQFPSGASGDIKNAVVELKITLQKLPREYYLTLSVLMRHLKRVSDFSNVNNMPASNLGIVFGPTLLRSLNDSTSVSSLMNTVHQTRAIELLISNANHLFPEVSTFNGNSKEFHDTCSTKSFSSNQEEEMLKDDSITKSPRDN